MVQRTPAHITNVWRLGDDLNHCPCGEMDSLASRQGKLLRIAERANIPQPCRGDYRIVIEKDDWPGDSVMGITYSEFREQFQAAKRKLNSVIQIRLVLTEGGPGSPQFKAAKAKVQFYPFGGGVLADSHLADNTCDDDKRQRYDHRRWDLHQLYLTILHELMHLLGVRHHSGPFVINPNILTGLADLTEADVSFLVDVGYTRRTGPVPPNEPPQPQPPKPEPPTMDWIDLLLKFLPVILECINRDGESATFARLRRGGMRVQLKIWRQARKGGLRGKQARAAVQEAIAALAEMDDAELADLIIEAQEAAKE